MAPKCERWLAVELYGTQTEQWGGKMFQVRQRSKCAVSLQGSVADSRWQRGVQPRAHTHICTHRYKCTQQSAADCRWMKKKPHDADTQTRQQ